MERYESWIARAKSSLEIARTISDHDIIHYMRINDRKKAALFAYWVIKLRPVKIIDNGLKKQIEHIKVNEKLALNHLLCDLHPIVFVA